MEKEPLISVLMGAYNCASTLEEAVQCICKQTWKNWELILCDDCSTDRTWEVAARLAEQDSRIRLLKNEKNLTLAPTLNRCLAEAKGSYLARMDADDRCSPERLEKELCFLAQHPEFAFVSCNMELFDQTGVFGCVQYRAYPAAADLANGSQFCHAGCMLRKEALERVNGYNIDRRACRVEDFDLWFRLYAQGYCGANLQETLYSMRDDRNAVHRRKFKYRLNESRVILAVCRQFRLPFSAYISGVVPVLKGLLPGFLYQRLHNRRVNEANNIS